MFSDIITLSFVSTSRDLASQQAVSHLILKHYCVPLTSIQNMKILWQKKESCVHKRQTFIMDIEVLFLVYFANVISWHFTRALIVTLTAPELHIWLMSGTRHRTEGEIDIRTHFYFSHFPNLPNMFSRPRVCREEFCREHTNVRAGQSCLCPFL